MLSTISNLFCRKNEFRLLDYLLSFMYLIIVYDEIIDV